MSDFMVALPARGSLLGLDLGTKTIGVAASDGTRLVATPVETIRRVKFTQDIEALKAIIKSRNAVGLVLGLPLNMDGSEGPRVQSTRTFAINCAPLIDLPVVMWDERLSTVAVTKYLLEADVTRKKRAEVVDRMAAAFILQGFLDFLRARAT
ncbi:Holliday junction resolvase RuvX [Govanella unica]|uniref:Putative pre-16S rRNA nuclease n=1 Tax=Govanella unica TaxID=2975056 RepID=A0A9X3TWP5_9PROT|nr:Holliday junction resolvase RuvX [Govania unica]MDA5193123.1 Holliday junction resolvase RuvX [Govania unica]